MEAVGSLTGLLVEAREGDYLAIMAYLCQTPAVEQALLDLRRKVLEKYHLITTTGYGPRLLHSTGQLHKGGPNTGLFLQITTDHKRDLPIPGEPYTFAVLADAQAIGDFQTLQSLGRRAARIHSSQDDAAAIAKLIGQLV
jgi:hypothetical protein